ncbi:MFS transporter [Actinomadura luteofluorescens]|uniref:MFS transporter n=1 Tax=Actinomadura luteofluorescens TaxID=46163 RepID=UPI002164D5E0|nr:MFS transporter [Actinomadura glauciflava]
MTATYVPAGIEPPTSGTAEPRRMPPVIRLLVLATFMVVINETIMINAIPRLTTDMHVNEQAAQWPSTAFTLTMAAVTPATGRFLQRVTARRAFATAMAGCPPTWTA